MKLYLFVFGIVSYGMTHFSVISLTEGRPIEEIVTIVNVNLGRVAPDFKSLNLF